MATLLFYPNPGSDWQNALHAAAPNLTIRVANDISEAVALAPQIDAFYGTITPQILAAAVNLRWIQTPMAGLEQYMFPELISSPVILTNMRGIYSDVIADHVLCLLLAFARDLPRLLRAQQQHRWLPEGEVAAFQLQGKQIGIIGFGGIGGEVARRALVVGMTTIACDPAPHASIEGVPVWSPERLDELLAQSDIVVVCAPETPETRGLFDTARFSRMRPGSIFINVGRGRVVHLDALAAALQSGHLSAAALDVYEREPLPPDHPLWSMPQVILTPHSAAYAVPASERRKKLLVENVRRFLAGEPLLNVVNKQRWS